MKRIIVTLLVVAILASMVGIGYAVHTPRSGVAQLETASPPTAEGMLKLVNDERAKVGVKPLVIHETLNKSAQFKADDMYKNNYFSHTAPGTNDNNGLNYLDSIDDGLCSHVGENITDNLVSIDNTSEQSVYNWIHSPAHYKAMIDPKNTLTGFGISGTKIVQHFCVTK